MPKEYSRVARVADVIQKELTIAFQRGIADPRLRFVTITMVKVSRNLASAKIFFTKLEHTDLQGQRITEQLVISLLRGAASRLRYLLAKRLKLRTVPELQFSYDHSDTQCQHLCRLIDGAIEKDRLKSSVDMAANFTQ